MRDKAVVESAWLMAKAKFEKWVVKFHENYYAPTIQTLEGAVIKKLQNLPPEVQQISRQMHPKEWKELDKFGGKKNAIR